MDGLPAGGPVLHVSGLNVTYTGRHAAFAYPEIRVGAGRCLWLSGPSGCGKTTLLNAIFQSRFPGRVEYAVARLNGRDVMSYGQELYSSVSYIPQYAQDGLNPTLTIERQIALVIQGNGVAADSRSLEEDLSSFGLRPSVRRMYPHQMSGGMKQRLVLFLALLKRPALLILDEPSSAVDSLTLMAILKILASAKLSGTPMLLVSHDAGFGRRIADDCLQLGVQ